MNVFVKFRMRYKDYKVPLTSLTKEHQEKVQYLAQSHVPGERQIRLSTFDEVPEDETVGEAEGQVAGADAAPEGEGKKKRGLVHKFVNLVDILPPLPEKGQFDVRTIKKSLYFFS